MNKTEPINRIPPHNKTAEESVLGSIMLSADLFMDITETISADDFYFKKHQVIFSAMNSLAAALKPIDIITVCEELSKQGQLEAVGGRQYISSLPASIPTTANAKAYAEIIAEKSLYRKMINVSSDIAEKSFAEKDTARVLLDKAEAAILKLAPESDTRDYAHISQIVSENIEAMDTILQNGKTSGLSTGFKSLDRIINGLKKTNLIIIGARPSVGKTAFALNIAHSAATKQKKRVVVFSLEQSRSELGERLLSMQARVDSRKIQNADLDQEEWNDVFEAAKVLSSTDFIVDDTSKTVMSIRNKCRRFTAEKPLDLVIIDYLQLMNQDKYIENRANAVASDSKALKQLAKELNVPIIALAQLNRDPTKRSKTKEGEHRPMMSDIKDSGAIEQDADVIMLLHREDYYNLDPNKPNTNTCEVIVAKHRNGETGRVTLTWLPKYTKFVDMEYENK